MKTNKYWMGIIPELVIIGLVVEITANSSIGNFVKYNDLANLGLSTVIFIGVVCIFRMRIMNSEIQSLVILILAVFGFITQIAQIIL